ncbi:hypothetical protein ACW9HH_36390 [Nocardia gipuzkoensis]
MIGEPTAAEVEQAAQTEDWQRWLVNPDTGSGSDDEDVVLARYEDRQPAADAATVAGVDSHYDETLSTAPALVDRSGAGQRKSSVGQALPSKPRRREPRRSGPLAAIGITVAVVLVVVVVLAVAVNTDKAKTAKRAPAASTTVAATSSTTDTPRAAAAPPHAHTLPGCAQKRSDEQTSGTGPGGTESGPDAILAFEHAYYVLRSGVAARSVVDGTSVSGAEQIQAGIDQVPADTRYCVEIKPLSDGRFLVDLSEQWPGEQIETFTQVVTTLERDGRTLITAIAPA